MTLPTVLTPPLVAACVTLLACGLLVGLAPRVGWGDGPDAVGGRKRQRSTVPTVGGAAMLLGLLAGWALFDASGRVPEELTPGRGLGRLVAPLLGSTATLLPLGACCVAFVVGLADDLLPGGLRPRTKVLGQGLAGAVLGAPLLTSSVVPTSAALCVLLGLALGAILVLNLINTFDNADGAAGTLGVLGLAAANPLLAAPVVAFLPFNLVRLGRSDSAQRQARAPLTYMGDAGSHLLGILLLATPLAWPILWLPALDLARLSVLRVRSGSWPWVGDRRHLAHRLEQRGVPRLAIPAVLLALAAPSLLGAWSGAASWAPAGQLALYLGGAAMTAALFATALALTPDPGPCGVRGGTWANAPSQSGRGRLLRGER